MFHVEKLSEKQREPSSLGQGILLSNDELNSSSSSGEDDDAVMGEDSVDEDECFEFNASTHAGGKL